MISRALLFYFTKSRRTDKEQQQMVFFSLSITNTKYVAFRYGYFSTIPASSNFPSSPAYTSPHCPYFHTSSFIIPNHQARVFHFLYTTFHAHSFWGIPFRYRFIWSLAGKTFYAIHVFVSGCGSKLFFFLYFWYILSLHIYSNGQLMQFFFMTPLYFTPLFTFLFKAILLFHFLHRNLFYPHRIQYLSSKYRTRIHGWSFVFPSLVISSL